LPSQRQLTTSIAAFRDAASFAIAKRSTMRKAKIALARRLAIIMHSMLRDCTEFKAA
jgi:hypothetical protein